MDKNNTSLKAIETVVARKWTGHYGSMKDAFSNFMENDIFSDVCVFCDSIPFRLHRVILAAGSEYFEYVFTEMCIPASNAVVIIFKIRREIFRYIIEYIYKGKVTIKSSDSKEFEDAAAELKIRGTGCIPSTWMSDVCPSDFLCVSVDDNEDEDLDVFKPTSKSRGFGSRGGVPVCATFSNATPKVLKERNSMVQFDGASGKKNGNESTIKKRRAKSDSSKSAALTAAQPAPKRRRGPRPRQIDDNDPESVLGDILDTVCSSSEKFEDVDGLVQGLVSEYQKIVDSKNARKSKSNRKPLSEEHEKQKTDFEQSLTNAAQDVIDKLLLIDEAAALYGVSISGIRRRMKVLKTASAEEIKSASPGFVNPDNVNTSARGEDNKICQMTSQGEVSDFNVLIDSSRIEEIVQEGGTCNQEEDEENIEEI